MKKAKEFIKKYQLSSAKSEDIKKIIKSQGFEIIYFNRTANIPNVNRLISALKLTDYIKNKESFIYLSEDFRLLFITEGLTNEDELYLLLHEEGHIFCDHIFKSGLFENSNIQQEKQANDFASYIIKTFQAKKSHLNAMLCFVAILIISVACIVVYSFKDKDENKAVTTNYSSTAPAPAPATATQTTSRSDNIVYVTISGEKYHRAGCRYVKGRETFNCSKDEAIHKGYEACSICKP